MAVNTSGAARRLSSSTNAWFVGLAVGLIATFGFTMFVGRAGSDLFKDEVAQSLMGIGGLDGLLEASSSQAAASGNHGVAKRKTISKSDIVTTKSTSIKQKLEDEPPSEEQHEAAEAPPDEAEEPEEPEDCAIKLANGGVFE
jgi:hypothetical protein